MVLLMIGAEIMNQELQIASFKEKNEWLNSFFDTVTPYEFYRDLFPVGSFERKGCYEDNKPNGIVLEIMDNGKTKRETVTDDLSALCEVTRENFTIVSPISYFGYQRNGVNARFIYALAFDLDGVQIKNLRNVLHQMENEIIPKATYICNSGNGLHLYYVLNEPLPLYPQNQKYLKAVKYALTKRLWNGYTSSIEEPQMQGVLQGFRVVGSPTKFGKDYPVTAFRIGGKWDLQDLIDFIPDIYESGLADIKALEKKSKISIEEAKKKYPEWYERRIVRGEGKKRWNVKRDLYDWWLDRIRKEISVGHRYYAVMTLAIYAKKCNIAEQQLREDAFSLLDHYEGMTYEDNNHFEKQHIVDALELFNEDYVTFPRDDIAKLTGLTMTKNKRNGRKQNEHLRRARAVQCIDYPDGEWRNKDGRPSAQQIVKDYLKDHPNATRTETKNATGLSYPTIRKYYKELV